MRRRRPYVRPSGSVSILVVLLMLLVLLPILSLVLNVGHATTNQAALQNAADSAALAGAIDMAASADSQGEVTDVGMTGAQSAAVTLGGLHWTDTGNTAGDSTIAIPASDVTFGRFEAGSFTPSADRSLVNAMRVRASRSSATGNALRVFMAPFLGPGVTTDVVATAIAKVDGRCDLSCPGLLPIVIVDCSLDKLCGHTNIFLPDSGSAHEFWTTFNQGNAASTIRNIIDGSICTGNPDLDVRVGSCTNQVPGVKATDLQALQSTAYCNSVKHAASCASSVATATLPVVCPSTPSCPGSYEVVAFANVRIRAVQDKGSSKGVTFDIACGADSGNGTLPGTCPNIGSIYVRPVLVQ